MKYFFFILIAFVILSFCSSTQRPEAYAGQLVYVVKDATHPFGTVLYKNSNYKPNQPCIIVLHGIGERGSGNLNDLKRLASWGILQALYNAADLYGFNVLEVQTSNEDENGEIPYAYQSALLSLQADPNSIHLLCHSLGGYGLLKRVAENGAIINGYATITISASGPGLQPLSAVNLAKARQVWLFTSDFDHPTDSRGPGSNSGTDYAVTDTLYNRLTALGANVYETKYMNYTHNGVLSAFLAAFGQAPNNWMPTGPSIATGYNRVKSSWYGWIMNNHLTGPVKTPQDIYIPQLPPVVIPTVIHDTIQVHDTLYVHDTIAPPVVLKSTLRVYSDGTIIKDSL